MASLNLVYLSKLFPTHWEILIKPITKIFEAVKTQSITKWS